MITKRTTLALLCCLAALSLQQASPAPAAEEPDGKILEVIGGTSRTLDLSGAEADPIPVNIPVRLERGLTTDEIGDQTVRVTLGKEDVDREAFDFTLAQDGDRPGGYVLQANIDRREVARAGDYQITLQFWTPLAQSEEGTKDPETNKPETETDKTSAAPDEGDAANQGGAAEEAPKGEDPPLYDLQTVTLTLSRPAADLKVGDPLIVERVIALPFIWDRVSPDAFVVSETSDRSSISFEPDAWKAELRQAGSAAASGRLVVGFPANLAAGHQGDASLKIEGSPPLGTTSGRITFRSDQLATGKVEHAVEVKSRASLVWLILLILGSIALGYVARTRLETRKARNEAMAKARKLEGELLDLVKKTVDPDLKQKLEAVVTELSRKIEASGVKKEQIEAATTKAREDFDALVKAADEERAALQTTLTEWRAALGKPGNQAAGVAETVRAAKEQLEGQQRALDSGAVSATKAFMAKQFPDYVSPLKPALASWLTQVLRALTATKAWPETGFDGLAESIKIDVAALQALLRDAEETSAGLGPVIASSAKLVHRLRYDLLMTRATTISDLSSKLRAELVGLGDQALQPKLTALIDAENKYTTAYGKASPAALDDLVAAEAALHEALTEAITAATPGGAPSGLETGNFLAALEDAKKKRAAAHAEPRERALGRAPVTDIAVLSLRQVIARREFVRAPEPGASWAIRIKAPQEPRAGEATSLQVVVVASGGEPAPVVALKWWVDGELSKEGGVGDLALRFTPPQAGRVIVRAEATLPAAEEAASAEIELLVGPRRGYAAAAQLDKEIARAELIQTAVSGVLIALAGFLIFRATFVGTIEDVMAAVLWGFSVDIGVAKVREIAQPLLAKPVPVPG